MQQNNRDHRHQKNTTTGTTIETATTANRTNIISAILFLIVVVFIYVILTRIYEYTNTSRPSSFAKQIALKKIERARAFDFGIRSFSF